jgi:hypothetical protein
LFKGLYRFRNITFTGDLMATKIEYDFYLKMKIIVRVQGAKSNVKHSTVEAVFTSKANPQSLISDPSILGKNFKIFEKFP